MSTGAAVTHARAGLLLLNPFRWTKRGRFPRKHASGGWFRTHAKLWLTESAPKFEVRCQHVAKCYSPLRLAPAVSSEN